MRYLVKADNSITLKIELENLSSAHYSMLLKNSWLPETPTPNTSCHVNGNVNSFKSLVCLHTHTHTTCSVLYAANKPSLVSRLVLVLSFWVKVGIGQQYFSLWFKICFTTLLTEVHSHRVILSTKIRNIRKLPEHQKCLLLDTVLSFPRCSLSDFTLPDGKPPFRSSVLKSVASFLGGQLTQNACTFNLTWLA